jgi:hypothetical protein
MRFAVARVLGLAFALPGLCAIALTGRVIFDRNGPKDLEEQWLKYCIVGVPADVVALLIWVWLLIWRKHSRPGVTEAVLPVVALAGLGVCLFVLLLYRALAGGYRW